MRYLPTLRLLYGLLLVLLVAQGTWWVIFLGREGRSYEEDRLERLERERTVATVLLGTQDSFREDPAAFLRRHFPDLVLRETPEGPALEVDPGVEDRVRYEAGRRERMFLYEGIFFLGLLIAVGTVLALAYRAEWRFRTARELFLAGVTHEFRTPLASLQLYAETLDRPDLEPQDRSRIHQRMMRNFRRLEQLVEQVLAASRDRKIDSRSFEPLDLAAVVREVLDEMRELLDQEGAQVETRLPDGRYFLGQRPAFGVALRNLIHNAMKFSPPPARISVTLDRADSWHRLSVRDWGPGIRKQFQRKIFHDFYRIEESGDVSHRPTRGAGLGLYLARRNVEAFGGRLKVESREGEGSTFIVLLPVHEEERP
jgi:signal transduction histidine kinase